MSQTVLGENGGGGNTSHSSNKFFQQPVSAPVGANFLPQGQGGPQYGPLIPHFPVKPTNPHMVNGYRPPGPMQFNMHSSHMNSQHQHMHQLNAMKNRNESNASAVSQHPSHQQNHCGNLQYFPGGNYVTTVTVNPGDHHHQTNVIHPVQQQYIQNSQNYYMNTGTNVMNQMNNNMSYMQGMVVHENKNSPINTNQSGQKIQTICNSSVTAASEANIKVINNKEICKVSENSNSDVGNDCTKLKGSNHCHNSEPTLYETNIEAANIINVNSVYKNSNGISCSSANVKNCINSSVNNGTVTNINNSTAISNRLRTNSRCDSVRSETAESSCSSLSTESMPDQNILLHHNQHSFNIKNGNSNQHYHFANNQHYLNNQIQPVSNFNSNINGSNNGNMNYQNYMASQTRMGQVVGKPGNIYNNPNIVQAFQHVHVQNGQVQIMQQQYQPLQGQGMVRPTMGMMHNNVMLQSQPNTMTPGNSGIMQGQNITNVGMMSDHSNTLSQNVNMVQNCIGHNGAVQSQNFCVTPPPSGQFPHHQIMHTTSKTPVLHQQGMMGTSTVIPGAALSKPFPSIVVVPFGWKRLNNNGQIIYVSPSGSELRSPMEVCEYLTQENTCKCGLQCPLRVENIFCFDPKVPHRLTMPNELSSGEATKVCNHRRKLALAFSHHLHKQAKKEDGRKKRKRKVLDREESPTPSSTPSPAIPQPPTVNQMVPFNTQGPQQPQMQLQPQLQQQSFQMLQQQQQTPQVQQTQIQQQPHMQLQPPHIQQQQPQVQQQQQQTPMQNHHQQHMQQQQHVYQQNAAQNWNPMYGVPRMMGLNSGTANCQGNHPDNFTNMNSSHSCSSGSNFTNQHPQGCCENHHCFPGHHNSQPMHHGIRPPAFGNMPRPPFCRVPGVVHPQGGCIPQQQMQHIQHHPMMGASRPGQPMVGNNPMCRMPMTPTNMPIYGHGNISTQVSEGSSIGQDLAVSKVPVPEEGEKRRKGSTNRPRKRAKTVAERNSPCPNVDIRNLKADNAVSPFTGPGPPLSSPSPLVTSQSSESMVTSSSASIVRGPPVSGPSFMEDPNGYLAQQTALLNNTMSGGGVGQFSPQGPRVSPRPVGQSLQNIPVTSKTTQPFAQRPQVASVRTSLSSPSVVPLPSNVPLPARVSKASSVTATSASCITSVTTIAATSSCANLCASVHSKSNLSNSGIAANVVASSLSQPKYQSKSTSESAESSQPLDGQSTAVATAESSCVSHTVTVSYTSSSVTTTCRSESNSPHSSEDAVLGASLDSCEINSCPSETINTLDDSQVITPPITKPSKHGSGINSSKTPQSKLKMENQKKKPDSFVPEYISSCRSSSINSNNSSSSCLSVEAANKPLTPGPAESCMSTQSPLEMVQNIVSSIPLPASSDELTPIPCRPMHTQPPHQVVADHVPTMHQTLPHQQVLGPHVYNMGTNGMAGVMYNPGGAASGMLRGASSLVVHGATSSGSIPPGVIVSNSGNMVVVTSPFNTKVSVTAPVVCSNVTGIAPMVGVQTVPQVQVQPSIGTVQSHQLQPHLQQIQPVQPVVQFVNTFATMQTPVIIQNGSNLIQSPSGVSGVLGPASIIPTSAPAFVTSQPLLAVESSSHTSPHLQMTHVVTSASGDGSDENLRNRLTPIATPASTPNTPHSTPGSDSSPGGSLGGSGRKRKRRRNTSTPQGTQQLQQQNIMPAIIMGKQIPQHMVMNGTQISQVSPYGNVTGAQMATVATMGRSSGPANAGAQMLTATGQPTNSINVVQMVGGPVTGHLPVHLQQPHTILVPSAATTGLIINQLPDGTFVSTDPNSGLSYPVHLQLSGSHIVGVTPAPNTNSNQSVVGSINAPSVTQGTMVTVRQPHSQTNSVLNANTKLINISPNITTSQGETLVHNMYGVSATHSGPQSSIVSTANVCSEYPFSQQSYTHHQQQPCQQHPANNNSVPQSLIVGNGNATLLQQKTTTIVAQHTTVVATQGNIIGTHSSVSTQTPGVLGESDVTSSDSVASTSTTRELPTSPSHQSAEITTTRQDEDSASTPESLVLTPPQGHSPEASSKKTLISLTRIQTHPINGISQEPHSASTPDDGSSSEKIAVVWGSHRGHQYWPAQVLHQAGGEVTLQWYGDHLTETVPVASLSNFPNNTRKITTRRSNRGRTALDEAIAEASLHVKDCLVETSTTHSAEPHSSISCSLLNLEKTTTSNTSVNRNSNSPNTDYSIVSKYSSVVSRSTNVVPNRFKKKRKSR